MLPRASMSSGRRGVALDSTCVASAGAGEGHGGTDKHGWGSNTDEEKWIRGVPVRGGAVVSEQLCVAQRGAAGGLWETSVLVWTLLCAAVCCEF